MNPRNVELHPHPTNLSYVRLTWDSFRGRNYADFDPCPYRKLTAKESALRFAQAVLGTETVHEPSSP